ncbi:phosphate-starvation-inducible protein PsiE [Ferrovum sp.]|uniref:phosphate-starvation-inducible protein PsiE n=1 Tax=Ferrovum sp. TaxID=2609467 RepID=UPI002602DDF4|nr:phosphate-starvation-inducible PsiE family protein [Ferrovum sp.]
MKNLPHSSNSLLIRALNWAERLGLVLIAGATLVAISQEMVLMVNRREVMLHDILLFFIYLEILTMVGLYFQSGKLPIRYPIYIAMVAIARHITIGMTEMDGWTMIGLSTAILVLALAVLAIRYGHIHLPYDEG